jgi:hypothetical protein
MQQEIIDIVGLWNAATNSEYHVVIDDRFVMRTMPHLVSKINQYNPDMIIEAIGNYGAALSLEDSQTHKHKFVTFLRIHLTKYLEEEFNIENHKKSNFEKNQKTSKMYLG